MNNYIYIIASMPVLNPDSRNSVRNVTETTDWIESQLGEKDRVPFGIVRDGFVPEKLDGDFYRRAFASGNRFVREYFACDLRLRNAKVEYLNRALSRPSGTDVLDVQVPESGFSDRNYAALFNPEDGLLDREKALDAFLWQLTDELNPFGKFNLDAVLGIVVKLRIIGRWMNLDAEKGREFFKTLIENVRGTYGKIEFETIR